MCVNPTTPWDETWKPVVGCPDYEVSDHGNVRSYLKKGNHKRRHAGYPRLLKLQTNSNGYPTVSLPKADGRYQHVVVHRIVMEAFVGACPDGMEVAHLNGIRDDNRLANLCYVTHIENESHKKLHGTDTTGERNGQSRLLGWQVAEIKYLAEKGVPQSKIASLFDLDRRAVSDILREKVWGQVSARIDIPNLCDEVEALRCELARAREALEAVIPLLQTHSCWHDVFPELDCCEYGLVAEQASVALGNEPLPIYAEHMAALADAGRGEGE